MFKFMNRINICQSSCAQLKSTLNSRLIVFDWFDLIDWQSAFTNTKVIDINSRYIYITWVLLRFFSFRELQGCFWLKFRFIGRSLYHPFSATIVAILIEVFSLQELSKRKEFSLHYLLSKQRYVDSSYWTKTVVKILFCGCFIIIINRKFTSLHCLHYLYIGLGIIIIFEIFN